MPGPHDTSESPHASDTAETGAARRYIILGAGGVGGGVGGMLAVAGLQVELVARGRHLEALRRDGLRLRTPTLDRTLALPVHASPADIDWRPGDVAILATKLQDADALLEVLVSCAATRPPVVCASNGLAAERMVARRGLPAHGMLVWTPATHLVPGEVRIHASSPAGVLDVGSWPQGTDEVNRALARDLTLAGFDALARDDIMAWKRCKLLTNAVGMLAAIDRPAVADLKDAIMDEARAVFRAAGLSWIPLTQLLERTRHVEELPIDGMAREGGSAWQSLVTGRTSEVDWLCGEIVARGVELGVPTPANRELQARVRTAQSPR